MKTLFTLSVLFISISVFCQTPIKLILNNPAPRVNEAIELSFKIDFIENEIKNQLPSGVQISEYTSHHGCEANFTRNLTFEKSGSYTIGPFVFNHGGKELKTESVVITVAEELPFKPGIWARCIKQNEETILIIEQYTINKKNKQNSFRRTSFKSDSPFHEKDEFAELKNDISENINFVFRRSFSTTQSKNGDLFASGLKYSRKMYIVDFSNDSPDSFSLKKKHFDKFPKGMQLNNATIQK